MYLKQSNTRMQDMQLTPYLLKWPPLVLTPDVQYSIANYCVFSSSIILIKKTLAFNLYDCKYTVLGVGQFYDLSLNTRISEWEKAQHQIWTQ